LPAYLCRTLKIKRLRPVWRRPEAQMSETVAAFPVDVTDRAARRVAAILAKEAPGSALRVAVNGGGCSGFQYAFDVTQEREPEDLVIEKAGAIVLVDSVSLGFLRGTRIDFVDDLIGQSFKIDNPNVKASCGCGASFTV
jgi:iron-sulfur cluster assembly accessory protein